MSYLDSSTRSKIGKLCVASFVTYCYKPSYGLSTVFVDFISPSVVTTENETRYDRIRDIVIGKKNVKRSANTMPIRRENQDSQTFKKQLTCKHLNNTSNAGKCSKDINEEYYHIIVTKRQREERNQPFGKEQKVEQY
uniref:Uncharacterized protein n=1 Tax=Octopus bimaculoides TaxID=37653 RepID=A0A0L8IDD5_OCTBM